VLSELEAGPACKLDPVIDVEVVPNVVEEGILSPWRKGITDEVPGVLLVLDRGPALREPRSPNRGPSVSTSRAESSACPSFALRLSVISVPTTLIRTTASQ